MAVAHAVSCLYDELKCSVNESGHLDNAKQIVSWPNCSQDDVASSRTPSNPIYIFTLPAHLTYSLQNVWHTLLPSATASHHPWRYIQYSWCFFGVKSIWYIHYSIIDYRWEPTMYCGAFWLPKSVVADTSTLQISTLHVRVWAENPGVGVS